jgi:GNAT superfamily N-acetyltransferase
VTEGPGGAATLVRVARSAADWHAVRSLCCRTGDAGDPIDPARWPLFAELWIGPYQRLVPAWTYVAEAEGGVVGYLTGCPDTVALRRAQRLRFTLPLLARIACGRYPWSADARRTVRLALHLRRDTESRLAAALPGGFSRSYPAHLHMNVEAGYRRRGIGSALIERYAHDLQAAAVSGIHLFCGPAPRSFYARQGFTEFAALEISPGHRVYTLGRRLAPASRRVGTDAEGGRPPGDRTTAGGA